MKAIVHEQYGSPERVLRLRDVDRPRVGDGEVLVRVCAASVHPDIWHVVTGFPYVLRLMGNGVTRPKHRIPGSDLAGIVEAVGANVADWKFGDEVFGESGLGWRNCGTFAEYASVRADVLARKPPNVTFEQAGSIGSSGYIAVGNLRLDGIHAGARVLVNGAGGNVGTIAMQLAKARGAQVTAVDRASKLDMLRALGADVVVDCDRESFANEGGRYDMVFDVASTLTLEEASEGLTPNGRFVLIGHDHFGRAASSMRRVFGGIPQMMRLMVRGLLGNPHIGKPDFAQLPSRRAAMETLAAHLQSGTLTPVIGQTFPLEGVVDAMRAMQSGQVVGRIVITPHAGVA